MRKAQESDELEALQTAAAADARAQRRLIEGLEAKLAATQAQVPQVRIEDTKKILRLVVVAKVSRKILKDFSGVHR